MANTVDIPVAAQGIAKTWGKSSIQFAFAA